MKYVSWFDGVGMFSLALNRAGMECVGACEIDKFARKVRTARLGAPAFYPEDVNAVRADDVPDADVWIGGSPCQDFSVAGKRAGLEGARSGLLRVWLDLLLARRPRWFILENVPGMLTASEGRDFGELLATLGNGGYRWAYRVLDGQHFGVAQRRRRVFVVAHLGDGTDPAPVLFEREGGFRDPASLREKGSRAAARAASGSRGSGEPVAFAQNQRGEVVQSRVVQSLSSTGGGKPGQGYPAVFDAAVPVGLDSDREIARALTTSSQRLDIETENFALQRYAGEAGESAVGCRRLVPGECEALQGLPRGWTCTCPAHDAAGGYTTQACKCPDGPRYRAIGNGGVVPCVEWIARRLVQAHAGSNR